MSMLLPTRTFDPSQAHRLPIVLAARVVLFGLCFGLTAITPGQDQRFTSVLALLVVATLASLRYPGSSWTWLIPVVEGVLAAAVIGHSDPFNTALLPYLLVPALAVSLSKGFSGVVATTSLAGAVIFAYQWSAFRSSSDSFDLALVGQWLVVALAIGLIGSWFNRILASSVDSDSVAYESAYRLLDQLRQVSRQLSVGLDATTLSESLLDEILEFIGGQRGSVYVRFDSEAFSPLSSRAMRPEEWKPQAADDSAWARAWQSGEPQILTTGLLGEQDRSSAVIPLRVVQRTVALVGVERVGPAFDHDSVVQITDEVANYGVRVEASLLFSEVRFSATTEERRRLARDIHDGVAQELASLGYAVDDLSTSAEGQELKEGLQDLRKEVTRIITELRLSIFDLRSDVSVGMSLNVALSEYIRSLAIEPSVEVHLQLQEAPERLSIDTEAELLRIAQEALTNARKHANASNIWVTSRIQPPNFDVIIEDDGQGLGPGREDSYGLKIMRERAERINGRLEVTTGEAGGTKVQIVRA